MQKFWYHSPVRFYKYLSDLEDMTNPQNTQFFGAKNPYPIELGVYHRFLIPNFNNEVVTTNLKLYLINETETLIDSKIDVVDNKLCAVTFKHDEIAKGTLEIRDDYETLFYSNCIRFMDSTDSEGRKFIRIITKNLYDKNLFPYAKNPNFYTVTNLPAYCLGMFSADVDVKNSRVGNSASLITSETYTDEVLSYEFAINGDANILTFIQVNAVNSEFYIDGTRRTALEKIDVDDFAMVGKMNFVNVKDINGLNVTINEDDIFSDLNLEIIQLTPIDDYIDQANLYDGSVSAIFNSDVYSTGDLSKKMRLFKDGVEVLSKNFNELTILGNEVYLSYATTSLEHGNYYVIIDGGMFKNSLGGEFDGIANNTDWNFTLLETITPSVTISWSDNTTNDLSGILDTETIKILNTVTSPSNPIVFYAWEQSNDNINFTQFAINNSDKTVSLVPNDNYFRLKATLQNEVDIYSNVLKYTRKSIPVTNYYYKAIHPYNHTGNDFVRYIDKYGQERIKVLIRSHWEDFNNDGIDEWVGAPCTLIKANQILETQGAITCTP